MFGKWFRGRVYWKYYNILHQSRNNSYQLPRLYIVRGRVCVQNNEEEEREIEDLLSLGINPRRKTEFNDKNELAELAENLKQALLQDYRMAYSDRGHEYEEEAKSTVNP
ncbi:hypothetical protein NTE_01659 [Candidatus Nitrososphaera evergladensis SR1]|uniref:Uncharacterized protein n=1 Tax=Candidatus Nitrososphaera evergladensis SR1 TaxID=1459636 RepID=A0A075MRN0_9ARCH|nr:hypothetical protein [Candidatus Nitrososphaera evergladensis]AIF83720.1 hypothetical protein NTE_01659 [Candidatus Nitrososphaera evergladensis SR1]